MAPGGPSRRRFLPLALLCLALWLFSTLTLAAPVSLGAPLLPRAADSSAHQLLPRAPPKLPTVDQIKAALVSAGIDLRDVVLYGGGKESEAVAYYQKNAADGSTIYSAVVDNSQFKKSMGNAVNHKDFSKVMSLALAGQAAGTRAYGVASAAEGSYLNLEREAVAASRAADPNNHAAMKLMPDGRYSPDAYFATEESLDNFRDREGRPVDKNGNLIDKNGNFIDEYGRPMKESTGGSSGRGRPRAAPRNFSKQIKSDLWQDPSSGEVYSTSTGGTYVVESGRLRNVRTTNPRTRNPPPRPIGDPTQYAGYYSTNDGSMYSSSGFVSQSNRDPSRIIRTTAPVQYSTVYRSPGGGCRKRDGTCPMLDQEPDIDPLDGAYMIEDPTNGKGIQDWTVDEANDMLAKISQLVDDFVAQDPTADDDNPADTSSDPTDPTQQTTKPSTTTTSPDETTAEEPTDPDETTADEPTAPDTTPDDPDAPTDPDDPTDPTKGKTPTTVKAPPTT